MREITASDTIAAVGTGDAAPVATSALRRPAAREPLRYRGLYPAWEGSRPVSWYFTEQLLEARASSDFPTSAAGWDEDVNVYLAGLLAGWVAGVAAGGVVAGRDPLLQPPDTAWPAAARAQWYRRQADHRLLALGLFDRGDLVRRRTRGWRMTAAETRRRDRAVALWGYRLAAALADGRAGDVPALVAVWRKLARHLDGYVHVLQTLSRQRLGLGARLDDGALTRLLREVAAG